MQQDSLQFLERNKALFKAVTKKTKAMEEQEERRIQLAGEEALAAKEEELGKLTVAELKNRCKAAGLQAYSNLRKQQLVAALLSSPKGNL